MLLFKFVTVPKWGAWGEGSRGRTTFPRYCTSWRYTHMMQDVYPVGSFSWFPIMHHIGNQVIRGVLLRDLGFFCQVLTKIYIPDWENPTRTFETTQFNDVLWLTRLVMGMSDSLAQHIGLYARLATLTWWGSWRWLGSSPQRSYSLWTFWCKRRGTVGVWSTGTFSENSPCRFCIPGKKHQRECCFLNKYWPFTSQSNPLWNCLFLLIVRSPPPSLHKYTSPDVLISNQHAF